MPRRTLKTLTPYILEEQFKAVGLEFDANLLEEPEWYLKHTWTAKQEREFIKWLSVYLKVKLHLPMQRAQKMAAMWNLNYGWKTGETLEESN